MENPNMRVCPKCGCISPVKVCSFCHIEMIDTGLSLDDWGEQTDEETIEWEDKVLAKYAPNLDPAACDKRMEEVERERKEREEHLQQRPKCPTCGSYDIRATDAIEAAYAPSIHHSKTVGKSFVCRNCGYAW